LFFVQSYCCSLHEKTVATDVHLVNFLFTL
jgi:hypothetical protein